MEKDFLYTSEQAARTTKLSRSGILRIENAGILKADERGGRGNGRLFTHEDILQLNAVACFKEGGYDNEFISKCLNGGADYEEIVQSIETRIAVLYNLLQAYKLPHNLSDEFFTADSNQYYAFVKIFECNIRDSRLPELVAETFDEFIKKGYHFYRGLTPMLYFSAKDKYNSFVCSIPTFEEYSDDPNVLLAPSRSLLYQNVSASREELYAKLEIVTDEAIRRGHADYKGTWICPLSNHLYRVGVDL